MDRGFHLPKWAARSERRNGKPRQGTLGLSPYHRRLLCEPLEDRRLLSIGAYPELPGMHLVDPNLDNLRGQVIYLDFDGAKDVNYNGPIKVNGFDVAAFKNLDPAAGSTTSTISTILTKLDDIYARSGVKFTTVKPQLPNMAYSTVYIGGNDAPFVSYGSFLGLAEDVDVGNVHADDSALVFSENVALGTATQTSYAAAVADTITHEVGHLLGYAHENDPRIEGPLGAVAATGTLTGSNSTDAVYTTANSWVSTSISITGAPSNAVIDYVTVHWNVDSNYTSDIRWHLANTSGSWTSSDYTMPKTGDDWLDGYSETSDSQRVLYPSSSCPANGTWRF